MKYRPRTLTGIVAMVQVASTLAAQNVDGADRVRAPFTGEATASQEPELHRALGLLQYVLGDYPAAIDESGFIVNEAEFLEQHRIIDEVADILQRAGAVQRAAGDLFAPTLARDLETLRDAASERQPPAVVSAAVLQLRNGIIQAYGLRLAPGGPPRLERAAALYEQACSPCHGSSGNGRTALALRLTPPPTDFGSPRLRQTLSPYQVFNVVTFGIPGTAMPSYETLEEEERWDLAFHVMALRHDPPGRDADPHRAVVAAAEESGVRLPALAERARYTDVELREWFLARGARPEELDALVARARRLQE